MIRMLVILSLALLMLGCGSSKQVTRLGAETTTDLSGKWNDTDSRLVAEEMISDCISRPWLANFSRAKGTKPVVTVGTIRNETNEHIAIETFTKDFERELINAGQIRFVAGKEQRAELRGERQEQQEFASRETMKKFREELGADFVLMGSIKTIIDQEEGTRIVFYQTDLELIDVETIEKVWVGTKKIKKGISQGELKL